MNERHIPEDHPIRQVWQDNEKLRTMEGVLEYARSGDRRALKSILGSFILKVQNQRPVSRETLQFLTEVFLNWINGQTFDEAFYQKKTKGRPSPDSAERRRQAKIAWRIESTKDRHPERSYEDICTDVANEFGFEGKDPGAAVDKIRQKYAGPRVGGNK